MFRIVTFNANGVRSALTKGFFNWFQAQNADVLCIQELKAQEKDIPAEVAGLPGYQAFFHCAEKKGYSGCGIWCRRKPDEVRYGFGDPEFDAEGRYVEAIFGDLSVISCYFPSGSSSEERQEAKFRFLASFLKHMDELRTSGRRVILCGDVNIAHKEIDLKNPKTNRRNPGFTDEERGKMTALLGAGFTDTFRAKYPDLEGAYSWWSYRFHAREKNVGWRIDYFIVSDRLAPCIQEAAIHSEIFGSDHCPVELQLDV